MVINILEDITSELASAVLDKIQANVDEEIQVNIMSRGGDVTAGSAIIDALRLSPAIITTKVFGIAASMAAAISQAGDIRLIAEDALFQPHNAAALPTGRPTKENLQKAQETLAIVDSILLKSFTKSNLSNAALEALLIEDKPLTAQEAISMAFFDGSMEPIQAAAHLNSLIMSKEQTIADKLKAIRDSIIPKAVEETPAAPVAPVTPETAPDPQNPNIVTRDEFDALVKMVEELTKQLIPETPAPTMEAVVEAKLDALLAEIKSTDTIPVASATALPNNTPAEETPKVSFLEARQKEVQSKFKER